MKTPKCITDERTGLKYELVGDYYLIAGDEEPEGRPVGVWGQRHLRYIRQHHKELYTALALSGKLDSYLADLNRQAEEMFSQLVNELAEKDGITETCILRCTTAAGAVPAAAVRRHRSAVSIGDPRLDHYRIILSSTLEDRVG